MRFLLASILLLWLSPLPGRAGEACPPPSLSFYGAAGTIFGSCHLLDTGAGRFLLDCGLFQGEDEVAIDVEKRNRELLFDPAGIDAIFITHAHSDHLGRLPWLVKNGFSGPVYATEATVELARYMLEVYAWIFSRDGDPLYGQADIRPAALLLRSRRLGEWFPATQGLEARFLEAGHILGSAMLEVRWETAGEKYSLVYTGDLGNPIASLLRRAQDLPETDFLVLESTYGDRVHSDYARDMDLFHQILNDTLKAGGKVVIPSYVLGRTQKVLHAINGLVEDGLFPPGSSVYVDSVNANWISGLYRRHGELYDEETAAALAAGDLPLDFKGLREQRPRDPLLGAAVIIGPSGATTTGRILDHLSRYLPDPRSAVIFVGYQPEGGLGREILAGAESVRIGGARVPVRAKAYYLGSFSDHPDYKQILAWLRKGVLPKQVFLVHGQPESSRHLRGLLESELNIPAQVAEFGACVPLLKPSAGAVNSEQ